MHLNCQNLRRYVLILFAALGIAPLELNSAIADSCWDHNGSLMRLQDEGNKRWFYYEVPRSGLQQAGVYRGTLLFEGEKVGNWYEGEARVFSNHCPGDPLIYSVGGPVRSDQLQVTVRGTRELHKKCQPSGNFVEDTLVFTYARQC